MWIIIFKSGGGVGIVVLVLFVLGISSGVRQCMEDDAMRPVYHDALSAPPSSVRWHDDRGAKYLEKGDYNKAVGEFTKAVKIFPNPGSLNFRAAAYYGLGNLDLAVADWEAAVAMVPDNAALMKNLENAKKARGRKQ
jgi:Tfp pilus assembly protein PilF